MTLPSGTFPAMPPIGQPETFYARLAHQAESSGDVYLKEAAKVGQYITLALDPALGWEEKLKYFRHALKRHCMPPPYPDDDVWMFYKNLADLVRQFCGQEALRLACQEDDMYEARIGLGQERDKIEEEAEKFFKRIMGEGALDHCPDWFNETDWNQLKMIRDQWI